VGEYDPLNNHKRRGRGGGEGKREAYTKNNPFRFSNKREKEGGGLAASGEKKGGRSLSELVRKKKKKEEKKVSMLGWEKRKRRK